MCLLLKSLRPIRNEDALRAYCQDILEGLDYVHRSGIVHCDIKLANVFLNEPDREDEFDVAKLADFGLSRFRMPEYGGKALMAVKCGTMGYMAPEIAQKDSLVGPEIDMWSFGVMLYEMCVAYKPTKLNNYTYGNWCDLIRAGSGPIPFRKFDWKKLNPDV